MRLYFPYRQVCFDVACVVGILICSAFPAFGADLRGDLLGRSETYFAVYEDTLADLAISNDLGYVEIVAANQGIDSWVPGEGTPVVLPTGHLLPRVQRRGIVINLADQRLYYFGRSGAAVESFPIGVPTATGDLRIGETYVTEKRIKPTWIPPASVRAEDPELPLSVPPGPDNPLGEFALDTAWENIVIHGTNRPYGIGRRVSHGCFRLYPEDIEKLFKAVEIGTPVTVVDQPAKVGWSDDELLLEIHPSLEQADELEDTGTFTPTAIVGLYNLILDETRGNPDPIDWEVVRNVARQRTGIPTPIAMNTRYGRQSGRKIRAESLRRITDVSLDRGQCLHICARINFFALRQERAMQARYLKAIPIPAVGPDATISEIADAESVVNRAGLQPSSIHLLS